MQDQLDLSAQQSAADQFLWINMIGIVGLMNLAQPALYFAHVRLTAELGMVRDAACGSRMGGRCRELYAERM